MSTLRIEPVQDRDTTCTEYSIIDADNCEVAVVTGKALAQLFAAAPELLEVAVQSAAECLDCNGTGEQVVEHDVFGPQVTPCPDCSPTRELISRAGGVA